jgi:2-dehydro-3-deoxyphosphooctonate aldolase (KDO 8-P synthase)
MPICFDCTHSTQRPGPSGGNWGEGGANTTGGSSHLAPMLAKAATAAGVDALFLECHPEPKTALSDAATMLRLADVPGLLKTLAGIRASITG